MSRILFLVLAVVLVMQQTNAIIMSIDANACGDTFHSAVSTHDAGSSFQQLVLIIGTEGISSMMEGSADNVVVGENYHSRTLDYDLGFSAINRHTQWFSKIENDNLETQVFSTSQRNV